MRVRINFKIINDKYLESKIDVDYKYEVSSLLYNIIKVKDPDFAKELHDKGYEKNTKHFKMFSFSNFIYNNYIFDKKENKIIINNDIEISLIITSPIERIIETICHGFLQKNENILYFKNSNTKICIKTIGIQILKDPIFTNNMYFYARSPLVASKKSDKYKNGEYLLLDEDWNDNINMNLKRKYEILYNKITNDNIVFEWDKRYINRNPKVIKCSKFKNGFIKGILAPFFISGNQELIKVGYQSGFGCANSKGFGLVDIIN